MDVRVLVIPEIQNMIITWVATFILYLFLKKHLYKPIKSLLLRRQESIATDICKARELVEQGDAYKKDYEERIKIARDDANKIVEASRKRGEEIMDKIVDDARKESRDIIEKANEQAARERSLALEDVKSQAGVLAVAIAEKILKEKIDDKKQKQLIDKFVSEMEDHKWQM